MRLWKRRETIILAFSKKFSLEFQRIMSKSFLKKMVGGRFCFVVDSVTLLDHTQTAQSRETWKKYHLPPEKTFSLACFCGTGSLGPRQSQLWPHNSTRSQSIEPIGHNYFCVLVSCFEKVGK